MPAASGSPAHDRSPSADPDPGRGVAGSTRPPAQPDRPVTLTLGPALRPEDLGALCDRLAALLGERPGTMVICDVAAVTPADLVAVALLARLRLTARRLGGRLHVTGVRPELADLLRLTGLTEAVTPSASIEPFHLAAAGRPDPPGAGRADPHRGRPG